MTGGELATGHSPLGPGHLANSLPPVTPVHDGGGGFVFATVPEICAVSEETLAAHRLSQLRALSDRFRGMGFTWEEGTWSGAWGDGHRHDALGMGVLWLDVADCATCLMHDWPGWRITGSRGEGYGASDGTRSITCATRSQLVCRLVLAEVRPR